MSLTPQSNLTLDEVRDAFARWLGVNVTRLDRIGGGRNSQVYRLTLAPGPPANLQPSTFNLQPPTCALKAYFRHANDKRDRLATEYNSFDYLWANGFREIPQPLACDPKPGWAVYQFIEGAKIPPGQVTEAQVLGAADFLSRLRELSRKAQSRKLGEASEACFAPAAIVVNVRTRLQRVRSAECGVRSGELSSFLDHDFAPLLDEVTLWSERHLSAAGMCFTEELDWPRRTLSPSDFGFHNALLQPDGRVIFLDFEYFGWDDPAKMIADFLLHPAMDLSAHFKRVFASAIFRRFADWPELRARVESVYPLFGLKWCMIMLNEFLPDSYQRRQFAAPVPEDRSAIQQQQLEKARQMLGRIRREYQNFPYYA